MNLAGKWVGALDMVIDRDRKKIGNYTYELIPMDHAKIKPDEQVAKLIDALDKKWTPKNAGAGAQGAVKSKASWSGKGRKAARRDGGVDGLSRRRD